MLKAMIRHTGSELRERDNAQLQTLSDEALMAAYVAGDYRAFRELFRRYQPLLERLLRPALRDDMPDFVQQTFFHMHRARYSFTQGALFRPWLLTIAYNLKREHFRKSFRRRTIACAEYHEAQSQSASHDVVCELKRVLSALSALPERERLALELLCSAEHDSASVAEKLGVSLSALKSLTHRARKQLRAQI